MAQLLAKAQPGTTQPLTFTREGSGTLFYTARLRYAVDRLFQEGSDAGFHIAALRTRRTSRTARVRQRRRSRRAISSASR